MEEVPQDIRAIILLMTLSEWHVKMQASQAYRQCSVKN